LNAIALDDSRWSSDVERLSQQLRQLGETAVTAEAGPTVSFDDIDGDAIRYAVGLLPSTFKTKDVSEHPAVLATHAEVSSRRNYHTMIGRYLMKNRQEWGLSEPASPVDERGSLWTKSRQAYPTAAPASAASVPAAPVAAAVRAPVAPAPPMAPVSPSKWTRYRRSRWFMTTIPFVSCGLAAWLPAVWIASRRKSDPSFRRRMYGVAAAIVLLVVLGFVFVGSAPEDATGSATGPLANIGVGLVFAAMMAGGAIGFFFRDDRGELPGATEQLARRELREQYRELVARDRSLAASMMVGRPDLRRDYDDGGLLDLNSMSGEALQRFGGLLPDEAARLVELRSQLGGRFVDLNEVVAYIPLSEATIARLSESSVCV
jgi:hypothetical protein